MRLPPPWRAPALALTVFLAFLAATDPVGAVVVATAVAVVLGLDTGLRQLLRRHRARDRTPTSGTWTALLEDAYDVDDLFPGGRWWSPGRLRLRVRVSPSGLLLDPTDRRTPLRVGWADLADVRALPPQHEVGGRPRVLALTPVVLVLVGPHLDELDAPLDDEEAQGLTAQERAQEDADTLAAARDRHGDDWVPGTRPVTLLVDGADGLLPLLDRYRGGSR